MLNSHTILLRSRRSKASEPAFNNNNKKSVGGLEAFAYDTTELQMTTPLIDENISSKLQMSDMSTRQITDANMRGVLLHSKRSSFTRRTLSESSAEDLGKELSGDESKTMWRNELILDAQRNGVQPRNGKVLEDGAKPLERTSWSDTIDIAIRISIVIIFIILEKSTAFVREIHAEELWLYKNPRRPDIVSPANLLIAVIVGPFLISLFFYWFSKDKRDYNAATWAWTLALCMNAIPTSLLKITVGRPRPDFFYRCFPDGIMVLNENSTSSSLGSSLLEFNCTGLPSEINEGRKSFPSGHSSFAFASFGFITYYVGSKLHAFNKNGRGQTWRFCLSIMPLILAGWIAITRTCDYHHHWQDITVGSIIGLVTGYVSYRQYYPSPLAPDCDQPLIRKPIHKIKLCEHIGTQVKEAGDIDTDQQPLLGGKDQSKWY